VALLAIVAPMAKQDLALNLSALGLLASLHTSITVILGVLVWLLARSVGNGSDG
jgi:hypothetical protein